MQPLEAFKLGILGHGRALQSVGSPGDGSRSCEEWAGQERDKSGLDKKEECFWSVTGTLNVPVYGPLPISCVHLQG